MPVFSYSNGQQKSSQVCDFSIFFCFNMLKILRSSHGLVVMTVDSRVLVGSFTKMMRDAHHCSGRLISEMICTVSSGRLNYHTIPYESLLESRGSVLTRMVAFSDCKPLPRPRNLPYVLFTIAHV